jgi:uncharacterized membrane-anchored protein YhcB (DUF1043 family)
VVAAIAAAVVAWLLARWIADAAGLDRIGVEAGLISTFAGVVAGVPIALLLARIGERAAARQSQRDVDERRRRVLKILRTDLDETMDELVARNRGVAIARTLRTDVWQAMAASDQLTLIDDPELLSTCARAYHFIASTADLERQSWLAMHDPAQWRSRINRATGEESSAVFRQSLEAATRELDPATKAAIDVALTALSSALGVDPPVDRPLRRP